MIPTATCVVAYYSGYAPHWDGCIYGLAENFERLDRVVVVKDGLWEPGEIDRLKSAPDFELLPEVLFFDHPKRPHGMGESLNIGHKHRASRYVLQLNGRIKLPPGTLEHMLGLAGPRTFVVAPIHKVADWPHGPLVDFDFQRKKVSTYIKHRRAWLLMRNGAVLMDSEFREYVGGIDETFCDLGYGWEDLDLGARWLNKGGKFKWAGDVFGVQPICPSDSSGKSSSRLPPPMASKESSEYFTKRRLPEFRYCVVLFADSLPHPRYDRSRALFVGHEYGVDCQADCLALDWAPDKGLSEITINCDAKIPIGEERIYLDRVLSKLKVGGRAYFPISGPGGNRWFEVTASMDAPTTVTSDCVEVQCVK